MASFIVNSGQGPSDKKIEPVIFTPDDVVGIHYPYCDALVVRAVIARNGLKRILVDNGSSVNIIYGMTKWRLTMN